ncbi:MAG: hypothetical protein GXC73_19685 [Chitinophagaceae bacterium]|nr:hypothetical protein [Chitinophagaceae bacterium]
MKMEYFTENGANQVIKKYENLIGREFYFDERGARCRLFDILKSTSKYTGAFLVLFQSEKNAYVAIYDFMRFNKLEYHFHSFETIAIEET